MLPFSVVNLAFPPEFDPSVYPRTYRVSPGYRIHLISLGGIAVAGGGAFSWYFMTGHDTSSAREAVILASVFFLFVLLGAYLIMTALRCHVTLHADALVAQFVFTSRKLRRDAIAGRRLLPTQYFRTLVLLPRDRQKKLKVGLSFRTDDAFEAWLVDIPDLDAKDVAESKMELAADPDLGFDTEEREQSITSARKIARTLNAAGFAALLWGFFYPRPYVWLILVLAVLPLIALTLLIQSRGIYRIDEYRNDVHPNLGLLFFAPGLVLGMRAMLDINLLLWKPPVAVMVLLTAAMVFLIANTDSGARRRPGTLIVFFLVTLPYAYGLTVHADTLFDKSSPQQFQTTVVEKHVSEGKTTSYYLHLASWGPESGVTEVTVPSSLYELVPRGATVCIYLRAGTLRIPWYVVDQC